MGEFIHSVLANYEAVTAGTVVTYDLPVNPLSFILMTLRFQQDKADLQLDWDNVDAMLSKVEVLYKGSAVFSANGSDIEALQAMCFGFEPWIHNRYGDDDDYTYFTFLIPLGRKLYHPAECFPRSTRGELQLQVTYAASFTDIDAVYALFETVELPEASPGRYLRVTTLSRTPSAAGELDIELPIGHPIAGVLFWGTTVPLADANTQTCQYLQILVDNYRRYFSETNFECWHQLAALRYKPPIAHGYHIHQLDGAAYAQYMDTSVVKYRNDRCIQHHWIDFDPNRDDMYLLQTAGKSDVIARIYAGDTNPLRVLPCELVGV
ncbi:MAG: hypothetical protein AMJ79_12850 [Phycisphaerae bacterium SM23_30]|nr:MAG: hypothetical protein AMJ79_12850 [Phycisphaerae bacterium SM23_30]